MIVGIIIFLLIFSWSAGCVDGASEPVNDSINASVDGASEPVNDSITASIDNSTVSSQTVQRNNIIFPSDTKLAPGLVLIIGSDRTRLSSTDNATTGSLNDSVSESASFPEGKSSSEVKEPATNMTEEPEEILPEEIPPEVIVEGLPSLGVPVLIPSFDEFRSFSAIHPVDVPLKPFFSVACQLDTPDLVVLDWEPEEVPCVLRAIIQPNQIDEIREGVSDYGSKDYFEMEAHYPNPNARFGIALVDKETGVILQNKGRSQFVTDNYTGQMLIPSSGNYQIILYGMFVDAAITFYVPDSDYSVAVTNGEKYVLQWESGMIVEDLEGNLGVVTCTYPEDNYYQFRTMIKDPSGNYYLTKDASFNEMGKKEDGFGIDHKYVYLYANQTSYKQIPVYVPYSEIRYVIYGYLKPNGTSAMIFTPS